MKKKIRKKNKLHQMLYTTLLAVLVSEVLSMQAAADVSGDAVSTVAAQAALSGTTSAASQAALSGNTSAASQTALSGTTAAASQAALSGTTLASRQASSPDKTRSEAEWAMLRDNRLEWGEITGLVEEYNPDIRRELETYRKNEDRLKTAEQTSKSLAQAAEEYEDLAAEYDCETGGQLNAAQLRLQAENLREQAADNTGDKRVLWLGMQKSMLTKEKEVRNLFVDYYQAKKNLQDCDAETAWLKKQAAEVKLRFSRGLTLQSEVTNAEDAVKKNAAKRESLELEKKNAYRKLITSCGWAYDAQAEIGPLPAESTLPLTAAEKTGGETKALEASFLLQEDRIRLENAQRMYGDSNVTGKMRAQLDEDTRKVTEAYLTAYAALDAAGKAVSEARASQDLISKSCALAEKQLKNGTVSRYALEKKQHEKDSAGREVESAVLDLVRARVAYDTVCRGVTE